MASTDKSTILIEIKGVDSGAAETLKKFNEVVSATSTRLGTLARAFEKLNTAVAAADVKSVNAFTRMARAMGALASSSDAATLRAVSNAAKQAGASESAAAKIVAANKKVAQSAKDAAASQQQQAASVGTGSGKTVESPLAIKGGLFFQGKGDQRNLPAFITAMKAAMEGYYQQLDAEYAKAEAAGKQLDAQRGARLDAVNKQAAAEVKAAAAAEKTANAQAAAEAKAARGNPAAAAQAQRMGARATALGDVPGQLTTLVSTGAIEEKDAARVEAALRKAAVARADAATAARRATDLIKRADQTKTQADRDAADAAVAASRLSAQSYDQAQASAERLIAALRAAGHESLQAASGFRIAIDEMGAFDVAGKHFASQLFYLRDAVRTMYGPLGLLGSVGAISLGLLASGLTHVGYASIEAGQQEQQATADMAVSFKNRNVSLDKYIAKIKELGDAQAKFGITTPEVEESFARGVSYGLSPERLMHDLPMLVDVAKRAKMSLSDVMKKVTEPGRGQGMFLKELGVTAPNFIETQIAKAQGPLAKYQAFVAALSYGNGGRGQLFGGQAEAEANTEAGALAHVKASLDDLEGKLGTSIVLPALTKIWTVLGNILDAGNRLADGLGGSFKQMGPGLSFFVGLATTAGSIIGGLLLFNLGKLILSKTKLLSLMGLGAEKQRVEQAAEERTIATTDKLGKSLKSLPPEVDVLINVFADAAKTAKDAFIANLRVLLGLGTTPGTGYVTIPTQVFMATADGTPDPGAATIIGDAQAIQDAIGKIHGTSADVTVNEKPGTNTVDIPADGSSRSVTINEVPGSTVAAPKGGTVTVNAAGADQVTTLAMALERLGTDRANLKDGSVAVAVTVNGQPMALDGTDAISKAAVALERVGRDATKPVTAKVTFAVAGAAQVERATRDIGALKGQLQALARMHKDEVSAAAADVQRYEALVGRTTSHSSQGRQARSGLAAAQQRLQAAQGGADTFLNDAVTIDQQRLGALHDAEQSIATIASEVKGTKTLTVDLKDLSRGQLLKVSEFVNVFDKNGNLRKITFDATEANGFTKALQDVATLDREMGDLKTPVALTVDSSQIFKTLEDPKTKHIDTGKIARLQAELKAALGTIELPAELTLVDPTNKQQVQALQTRLEGELKLAQIRGSVPVDFEIFDPAATKDKAKLAKAAAALQTRLEGELKLAQIRASIPADFQVADVKGGTAVTLAAGLKTSLATAISKLGGLNADVSIQPAADAIVRSDWANKVKPALARSLKGIGQTAGEGLSFGVSMGLAAGITDAVMQPNFGKNFMGAIQGLFDSSSTNFKIDPKKLDAEARKAAAAKGLVLPATMQLSNPGQIAQEFKSQIAGKGGSVDGDGTIVWKARFEGKDGKPVTVDVNSKANAVASGAQNNSVSLGGIGEAILPFIESAAIFSFVQVGISKLMSLAGTKLFGPGKDALKKAMDNFGGPDAAHNAAQDAAFDKMFNDKTVAGLAQANKIFDGTSPVGDVTQIAESIGQDVTSAFGSATLAATFIAGLVKVVSGAFDWIAGMIGRSLGLGAKAAPAIGDAADGAAGAAAVQVPYFVPKNPNAYQNDLYPGNQVFPDPYTLNSGKNKGQFDFIPMSQMSDAQKKWAQANQHLQELSNEKGLGQMLGNLGNLGKSIVDAIGKGIRDTVKSLTNLGTFVVDEIGLGIHNALNGLKNLGVALYNAIAQAFDDALAHLPGSPRPFPIIGSKSHGRNQPKPPPGSQGPVGFNPSAATLAAVHGQMTAALRAASTAIGPLGKTPHGTGHTAGHPKTGHPAASGAAGGGGAPVIHIQNLTVHANDAQGLVNQLMRLGKGAATAAAHA